MGKRLLGADERPRYGAIVTARMVGGEISNAVGYGYARPALEDAIDSLERRGVIDRVLAISTPETIYTDLQGSRVRRTNKANPPLQLPERYLLTSIGRSDLSPPPPTAREYHKWTVRKRAEERLLAQTGNRHAAFRDPPKRVRKRPKRPRCHGRNTRGKRCQLHCLPGQNYCSHHLKESE
jgi:hypothetical protein